MLLALLVAGCDQPASTPDGGPPGTSHEDAGTTGGVDGGVDGGIDGGIDGGSLCVPHSTASCYGGPSGTENVGACAAGTRTCDDDGAAYGPCVGEVTPASETCATPVDDDCDGQVNEEGAGCTCVPGSSTSCFSGPAGTVDVGVCRAGTMTCNAQGTSYGACMGEVLPSAETCANAVDDDCDGQVNEEGAGCTCVPGSSASCFSGPAGTVDVGACRAGAMTCNALGTSYGPCTGEVLPSPETCATTDDDDCDGQVNEEGMGCLCAPNSTASCFTGPPGTVNVGACRPGTMSCDSLGTSYGPCTGEVLPAAETCNTPVDDDCDGQVNESGAGCVCVPGSTEACYSGPPGTAGVGSCATGSRTCNAQGTAYGPCLGEVLPTAEACATPADDDCDGQVNEGCAALTCNLLQENFDDGAAGAVTLGAFEAAWCDTVIPTSTNTPLCLSGRTLRTNDSTTDPTLWIYKHQASCTGARLTYSYYQFALANVSLTWQQSDDSAAVCEKSGTFTTQSTHSTLQACVQQVVTIPFGSARGLYLRFEHGTGTNALWLDSVQVELVGCDC